MHTRPNPPKRVQVVRLFHQEEMNDEDYDPKKVSYFSDKWRGGLPPEPGLFFVKNNEKKEVKKALYIESKHDYPPGCSWYHVNVDYFIENSEIDAWMPVYKTKNKEE